MNYDKTGLDKVHKFFKVLYYLVYVLAFALFIYIYYDAYQKDIINPEQFLENFGLTFAIVIALLAPIVYGVLLIVGLIELILSLANIYSDDRASQIKASILMMILPFLAEGLLIGIGYYINNL